VKRSTDTRKSPAEVKANMQNHYGELTDMVTNLKASKHFHRPAYQAGNLIEAQGQQLWHGDVTGYIARKYKIGSDTVGDNDKGKTGSIQK
jgi:hypothetical protein